MQRGAQRFPLRSFVKSFVYLCVNANASKGELVRMSSQLTATAPIS
jgi:hypothetical protein